MSNSDDKSITVHSDDGVAYIAAERRRQLELGWDAENDDKYLQQQLPMAAAAMALPPTVPQRKELYPFKRPSSFRIAATKMTIEERVHELARSGAFAAAEIDRLLRIDSKERDRREKHENRDRIIRPPGFEGRKDDDDETGPKDIQPGDIILP